MKKCNLLLCSVLVLINSGQAASLPTYRKTPQPAKSPVVRILETSYLIQKSQQGIESIELILQQAYDIAQASTFGSYSAQQRAQLDAQFQDLLKLVNPMVELSEFNEQNLLNLEGQDIVIHFGRYTVRFESTDITLAGLNLEDAALPVESGLENLPRIQIPVVNSWEVRKETYYKVQTAIRKIKMLRLQFADYHNTVCKYLPYLEPDYSGEARLGLEIVEASKTKAEDIKMMLERALALANESINGPYSQQQRTIMNNEFEQLLLECTSVAERVYYGMGIIDGQNQLSVTTRRQTFEFEGFDLTTAGLGLGGELNIAVPENAQSALPYIAPAIASVRQAIDAMTEYEETLSELLEESR